MNASDFESLIRTADRSALIEAVNSDNGVDGAAIARTSLKLARDLGREFQDTTKGEDESLEQYFARRNRYVEQIWCAWLVTYRYGSWSDITKLEKRDVFGPSADQFTDLMTILIPLYEQNPPAWLADWVTFQLDRRGECEWRWIRRLVKSGVVPRPTTNNYLLQMPRDLESLREDPDVLQGELFDLFLTLPPGALGVCYYIYHQLLDMPRAYVMNDAYTGSSYSNDAIRAELDRVGLTYTQVDDDALFTRAAQLVADGNVLGWFQGRMEWGPRALGSRSIIADPRRDDMKDILNARIKHREKFRPFAPSVLLEATGDYFDQSYPDPFMLKVYGVLPEKQREIPAVTHVDGTGRLQTVEQQHAPRYWSLINAFKQLTGTPVVLNTSFNENEPIVRTPAEAIDCFSRTRMDALAIGNFVVTKT